MSCNCQHYTWSAAGLGSSTVLVLGTCTWYLYLSTYLSVLDVLEYLVYENVKVLVLVLDQKYLVLSNFQVLFIKKCKSSYLFEYIIITVYLLGTNY